MTTMYHVGRNGQQTGPFSIDQLQAMAGSGELQPTDLVWKEGMAGWEPASTLPGVFGASAAPAPAPVVGSFNPEPQSQPSQAPYVQATVLPPVTPMGAAGPKPNGMALTGMILGIVSIVLVCCCYGLPFNIAGIIFSIIGMNQIKANPIQGGMGMAKAGLWCSIASLILGILLLILALAGNAVNWQEIINEAQKAQGQ